MRTWLAEYRQSLKHPQVEEVLDLFVFRPLAFLLVKLVYRSSLTPNQLTFLSIGLGVSAGACFGAGTQRAMVGGAAVLAAANVLDCADGMLARLKGSGSRIGRIIDGAGDYIMNIALYLGLGFGLNRGFLAVPYHPWFLAVAAGISAILHSMLFDYYRSEYMARALGKVNSIEEELRVFEEELERLRRERGSYFERTLIRCYLWYLRLQNGGRGEPQTHDPAVYAEANRLAIRLWSFLGPTTYYSVLIATACTESLMVFFYYSIVFGNLWAIGLWLYQRQILRTMMARTGHV